MCKLCNASAWSTTTGCGTNYGCYAGGQRMCRDCNGNIWMRVTTACGCCGYGGWNSGCGNGTTITNTQNDNTIVGECGYMTLCGACANTTSQSETVNSTTYPIRRCGCNTCGYNRCNDWYYGGC